MAQYQPYYDSFQRNACEHYAPTPRLSVSSNVYLPGSDVDIYTGRLKPDRQRRCRTQGAQLERERLERKSAKERAATEREMKKGGVRITWVCCFVISLALILALGFTVIFQLGAISNLQFEINELDDQIAEYVQANAALQNELDEACDVSSIGYRASQELNMIPSESVQAIELTAVDTRPRRTNATAIAQPPAQDVQSTPVPAIASN